MSASRAADRAALHVERLSVAYDRHVVISEASFTAPAGMITALIGPNGAGKSTALKGIAGLLESEGSVHHGDVDLMALPIDRRALHLALVPQGTAISIGFSAREVISLGRHPHRRRFTRESDADRAAVEGALAAVGALPFADRSVDELSGGQRQLVHIGRALAQDSPVLLLDEPTSALDLKHQVAIYSLLRAQAEAGAAVVVVLHDLDDVARWCDRAILLDDGAVRAAGGIEAVLDEDLLGDVYDVPVSVGRSRATGTLTVTPWPGRSDRATGSTAAADHEEGAG